jgi:hypothetical protein
MLTTVLSLMVFAPQLPPAMAANATQRYVDFEPELDHPGFACFVGKLEKLREGRRERLPDGQLGGNGQVAQVSGTQYFKVTTAGQLAVHTTLVGKSPAARPVLEFEVQLARLPDGKERRQVRTGSGAEVTEGMLALWVVEQSPKTKRFALLHVVPFDARADKGVDPQRTFVDLATDITMVNQRVHDLRKALADCDAGGDQAARNKAMEALRQLLAHAPELRRPEDDGLTSMHAGPFEQRARERVAAADKAAVTPAKEGSGKDGKDPHGKGSGSKD